MATRRQAPIDPADITAAIATLLQALLNILGRIPMPADETLAQEEARLRELGAKLGLDVPGAAPEAEAAPEPDHA